MFEKAGESLLGFTVTRVRSSEELGGRIVELEYEKTGTKVCWIDNQQENKLFSVAFKTLPENSTGVFHILEHSVLCGSAKYPVREPFVELLKSSMNTFLNAMTFADKTMYPVSSRNRRDFLNLTEVYLDAVFAPAILTNPGIFYQEGWHIEQDENGVPSYKGVVFNEMKGAMSGPENIAEQRMIEMLFPDTCYGFNSGGDPKNIPDLTYEQFCETYRRFYHPSNALIWLDGDIPVTETLTLIAEYLSRFEKSTNLPQITEQKPVTVRHSEEYELAKDEPLTDKTCMSIGKIIGTWRDRVRVLAVRVLNDVIAGTNDAPLKRAVLSAELAQEMSVSADDSIAQPFLEMDFKNVKDGREDDLLKLVRETAAALADSGLDKEALEASANRLAFRMQEPEEPQGLYRCMDGMQSWLHGGDPLMYLLCRDDFVKVREMIYDGSFEKLLRELYADENGQAVVLLKPSYTRGEELRAEEAARLKRITESWSDADRQANLALNEALLRWQQTPDTPEQLATLPTLPISEVGAEPMHFPTEEHTEDGVTVLYHPAAARDIVHVSLYFRLTDYTPQELMLLSQAGAFLGKLSTEKYSALKIQQMQKNLLGRLDFSLIIREKQNCREACTPLLCVRYSVLRDRMQEAEQLITEILLHTNFRQPDKIKETVLQIDNRMKQAPIAAGHALAVSAVMSRYSASAALSCMTTGLPVMNRIRSLAADFDSQFDALAALYERLSRETVCKARMLASVTAVRPVSLSGILSALPEGTAVPAEMSCTSDLPEQFGYVIPAQIGFAVQGWQLACGGMKYDGSMSVAAKILSLSYLWNTVRVQGGAYGTGLNVGADGGVFTYSYRDPSPLHSLEVNKGLSDFIRAFCESGEPLDGYIISTVSDSEPLMSPRSMGITGDDLWFSGRTDAQRREARAQMLAASRGTLTEQCKVWDAFAEQGAVGVVASDAVLAEAKELTICK